MRRFFAFVVCCVSLTVDPSRAASPNGVASPPPIVELKRRIALPVGKNAVLQVQLFAMEAARGQIYGELERECETLKATYEAECRLKGAVIDGQILVDLGGIQNVELAVTSIYELTQGGAQQ